MNRQSKLKTLLKLSRGESTATYSSIMRDINKANDVERRTIFMKTFKDVFDEAMNNSLDEAANIALLKAQQEINA